MAKNADFQNSLNRLRKNLTATIAERATRIADVVAKTATEVFVNNARVHLDDATPKDAESASMIETVKSNIYSSKSASDKASYIVSVESDPEGLNMFLEFGTGLVGSTGGHPEANKFGWKYAVNKDKYIYKNGKAGWFFVKYNNYLDRDDENPVIVKRTYVSETQWVSSHTRNGKPVQRYVRRRPRGAVTKTSEKQYDYWVFSQGLYPVRYFYKAKQEVRAVLAECAKMLRQDSDITINDIKAKIESAKL